jgi:hypothetical protein
MVIMRKKKCKTKVVRIPSALAKDVERLKASYKIKKLKRKTR